MADVADVMDSLFGLAVFACYPSGPTGPSVTGAAIHVGEGWPDVEDIQDVLAAGESLVSIYLVPGVTMSAPQVFDWQGFTVTPPTKGLTASVSDNVATLTGVANVGEYATLLVNGNAYSTRAVEPMSAQQVAADLLDQAEIEFPGATRSGSTLTFPDNVHLLDLRIGASATLGRKIHRSIEQFQVTTWAPNAPVRTQVGRAIDVAMKSPVRISMPDTTCALISPKGTRLSDREENKSLYRRDLLLAVQYDSVELHTGYEVTGFRLRFAAPQSNVNLDL